MIKDFCISTQNISSIFQEINLTMPLKMVIFKVLFQTGVYKSKHLLSANKYFIYRIIIK